ncbi:MAG: helix-turn-helix domain-containing protein [Sphingobacterium sp.]
MATVQYKDEALLKELGKRIKSIRENKKWSQEYFSEICEIDTRQLGRIERAETNSSISILKKIADKLDISLSDLFNF